MLMIGGDPDDRKGAAVDPSNPLDPCEVKEDTHGGGAREVVGGDDEGAPEASILIRRLKSKRQPREGVANLNRGRTDEGLESGVPGWDDPVG